MEVNISPDLLVACGGVYRIDFSDGHFYIGATISFPDRINDHLRTIGSRFYGSSTGKALSKMRGFDGIITISVVEVIKPVWKNRNIIGGLAPNIREREKYHIYKHSGSDMLLNKTRKVINQ